MSKGGGKRSLRLDFVDCQVRSSSAEGAAPLVDPSHVRRSSVDPNRGLYPRGRSRRRNVTAAPPVFQAASSLLPRTNSASHPSAGKSSPQANKITSYFVCGSKRPRSPPAEDRCEPDTHRIRAAAAAEAWHSDSSSSSDSSVVITAEFGLLPAVRGEEEWFSLLPIELLERILSHVSLQDLLLSCSHVCTRWYAVIRSPHFLVQRKRYYRYKSGRCSDATAEVQALCIAHCMHSVETCLPGLISYTFPGALDQRSGWPSTTRTACALWWSPSVPGCLPTRFLGPWITAAAGHQRRGLPVPFGGHRDANEPYCASSSLPALTEQRAWLPTRTFPGALDHRSGWPSTTRTAFRQQCTQRAGRLSDSVYRYRYMASFGESTWGLQEMLERHPKCDIVMEVLQGAFGDSLWPVKVGSAFL
ncbi:hypothetical protein V5799_025345 [Amblyomma americanum]|uniref:F-box domain-containing protein n=1 Tax=Amblyomma americanum TaxID=6943 RepID=A0AAQ4E9H1_AMBAM